MRAVPPYSLMVRGPLRGRVRDGRLVVDVPTDLPEGSEVLLLPANEPSSPSALPWPLEELEAWAARVDEADGPDCFRSLLLSEEAIRSEILRAAVGAPARCARLFLVLRPLLFDRGFRREDMPYVAVAADAAASQPDRGLEARVIAACGELHLIRGQTESARPLLERAGAALGGGR